MAKCLGPGCRGKRGSKGKEESILIEWCVFFFLYQEKALRSLGTLRFILSSSWEGAEAFIICAAYMEYACARWVNGFLGCVVAAFFFGAVTFLTDGKDLRVRTFLKVKIKRESFPGEGLLPAGLFHYARVIFDNPEGVGDVVENLHFTFWRGDSAGLRACTSAIAKTVRKMEGRV
jgi:hypothetical protein